MSFAIRDPESAQQATTTIIPLELAPVVVPAPIAQLPALVSGPAPHRESFLRIDALDKQLAAASNTAIARVGTDAPVIERARVIGNRVALGTAVASALTAAGVGFFGLGFEFVVAGFTGAAAAAAGGGGPAIAWNIFCSRWQNKAASSSPSAADLKDLRAVGAIDTTPVEAAALRLSATARLESLKGRKVHGFEAQELYGELQARGAKVAPAEAHRAQRFADVRAALAYYDGEYHKDVLGAVNDAISHLQVDEKVQLAPLLLERMFRDEAPTRDGLDFKRAYALHVRLWDLAHGLPDPEAAAKKLRKASAARDGFSDEDATIDEVAEAVEVQTPTTTALVAPQQSALATLDETLKAFENALAPNLARARSVTAASIAPAISIAQKTEPTPVALAAIGARARRFLEELDQRKLYGYEARQQLKQLAAQDANLSPALLDQIERIAVYRSTVDNFAPNALTSAGTERILKSIDELVECDKKPAAQRAYDRFFQDGVPRTKIDRNFAYETAQTFLMGLRAHIREG